MEIDQSEANFLSGIPKKRYGQTILGAPCRFIFLRRSPSYKPYAVLLAQPTITTRFNDYSGTNPYLARLGYPFLEPHVPTRFE